MTRRALGRARTEPTASEPPHTEPAYAEPPYHEYWEPR